MVDVPINAKVECADGTGGRSTGVIFDHTTWEVTHFVVRKSSSPHRASWYRLTGSRKRLPTWCGCAATRANWRPCNLLSRQSTGSESFHFCRRTLFGMVWVALCRSGDALVPLKREHIPAGELAVRQGARVKSTDGQVGRVDEFMVDPASRRITHLVLREGHLWSQKDVAGSHLRG